MIDEMKKQTERLFRRTIEEYEPFNMELIALRKGNDKYITTTVAVFEENFIIAASKLLGIQHPTQNENDGIFIEFTPKEHAIYYKVYGISGKQYGSLMFYDTYSERGLSDVTLIWFRPILREIIKNRINSGKYLADDMYATAYCQIWTSDGFKRRIYAFEPFWEFDKLKE